MSMNYACIAGVLVLATGCSEIVSDFTFYDADASMPQGDAGTDADADLMDGGPTDAGPSPNVPQLRHPYNGYLTGSIYSDSAPTPRNALRPRFVWEPVSGAERYEIQLSRECDVSTRNACPFESAVTGGTFETEWFPAENLSVDSAPPVGARWFWHVRSCSGPSSCSDWSETRFLEVGRMATDYNGDGYADLVVGATGEDIASEEDAGKAYLYTGSTAGLSTTAMRTWETPNPERDGSFGGVVTPLGDVNGDGFSDLAIGASLEDAGAENAGRVYVYYGAASGPPPSPSVTLSSPNADFAGRFGASIARAGDFNADGFSDVLVGAFGETVDGTSGAGRLYYYPGAPDGVPDSPSVEIDSPTPDSRGRFGFATRSAGDLNGDGFVDLAVGAFQEDIGGLEDAGRAFIYPGSPAGPVTTPEVRLESPSPAMGGTFGWAIDSAGDIDGDGLGDLLVSASREPSGSSTGAGRTYSYRGSSEAYVLPAPLAELSSPAPEDMGGFGNAITAGDLNGDGHGDVAVCALQEDVGGAMDAGRLHVFYGSVDGLPTPPDTIVSPSPDLMRNFCNSTGAIGDVNGDGFDDLAIGSWQEDFGGETAAGRVHLFLGSSTGVDSSPTSTVGSAGPQNFGGFGAALGR